MLVGGARPREGPRRREAEARSGALGVSAGPFGAGRRPELASGGPSPAGGESGVSEGRSGPKGVFTPPLFDLIGVQDRTLSAALLSVVKGARAGVSSRQVSGVFVSAMAALPPRLLPPPHRNFFFTKTYFFEINHGLVCRLSPSGLLG